MAAFAAPVIGAASGLLSGILGAGSVKQAGTAAVNADTAGIQGIQGAQQVAYTNAGQSQQTIANGLQANAGTLSPYTSLGSQASTSLAAGLAPGGQFTQQLSPADILAQNPGFQFQEQQGDSAIQKQASANGTGISGGELKDLDTFNQGLASTAYQQAFNNFNQTQNQNFSRLSQAAGIGQTAAGEQVGSQNFATGQSTATNQGLTQSISQDQGLINSDQLASGASTAASILGSSQSLLSGLNGVASSAAKLPWNKIFGS
jgi:hypothetical protein